MLQTSSTSRPDDADARLLAELGQRIAALRLERNISQQALADEAGLSRSTVRRLESGESTQLTAFLRILRVLELLGGLDQLLPAPGPSPIQELEQRGQTRKRASKPRRDEGDATEPWTWGEES